MNRSARAQAELDNTIQQFNAPRDANRQLLEEYASIISVGNSGQATPTTTPGKGSVALGALAGAGAGALAGAQIGAAGGPIGATGGAVIGGVLGILGTM